MTGISTADKRDLRIVVVGICRGFDGANDRKAGWDETGQGVQNEGRVVGEETVAHVWQKGEWSGVYVGTLSGFSSNMGRNGPP